QRGPGRSRRPQRQWRRRRGTSDPAAFRWPPHPVSRARRTEDLVWSKYWNVVNGQSSMMDSNDGGQEALASIAGLRVRGACAGRSRIVKKVMRPACGSTSGDRPVAPCSVLVSFLIHSSRQPSILLCLSLPFELPFANDKK